MEGFSINVSSTPKRVILAPVNSQNNGSPISPMANLKLLTKVATSLDENAADIFSQPHRIKKTPVKSQRQLRSLGYICKKFLGLYNLDIPAGYSTQISLNNLTSLLDIEKRRVYDIINIIASLRYASKVCKDKYSWFGNQYLKTTLCELRDLAYSKNYHILLQKCLNKSATFDVYDHNQNTGSVVSEKSNESDERQIFDDNRIGALCQKSMMLFLVAPQGEPLNFRIISQMILCRDIHDKTGMRRLYDISNVLESLGLIHRCDSKHMKRPTFIYSGPVLPTSLSDNLPVPEKRLTDIEYLSDTSLDSSDSKFSSISDFVAMEINEMENIVSKQSETQTISLSAKKQLFPDSNRASNHCFIKAPQSSFKLTSTGFVEPSSKHRVYKLDASSIVNSSISRNVDIIKNVNQAKCLDAKVDKSNAGMIRISKIARPLIAKPVNLLKISSTQSAIQNGGIYKVVKQGNIINLVQLRSVQ